jgi:putative ABC transport system permease protein
LRDGTAIGGARAELATLMSRYAPENEGDSADLVPLRDWYVGATSRRMLWGLLGAVALLLLTSCANVANLSLARGTGRAREMLIRTAIGATRQRLIAQLVVESVALAVVAGLVGLLFAMWTADVLVASLPQTSVYRMSPLTTDWRVLLFTFAVATVAGLLFGIAPALRYSRARFDLGHLSARTPSGSLQRLLLLAQTALAITLIASAALLARSFVQLWTIEPGFSSENVMAARISLPTSLPESRQIEFFSEVARRLEAHPAVQSAGAVTFLPLSGEGSGGFITFEGREELSAASGSRPGAGRLIVTPGYFDALRLTLKEGRFLNHQDVANSAPVVVVNEAMARRYWPGESPVGKRIKRGTPTARFPWMTVVGVVGDVRQLNLVDPVGSMIYLPLTQFPSSAMSLTVRTTASSAAVTALVRAAVREVSTDQPIAWIRPLDELVFGALGGRWLPLLWMSVFAGLSLVLAAIGVYGVVSYVVEQRRREFGIRMALGAARADLVRLAIRHGLTPALAGGVIGLVAAAFLARVNSALFAGVAPFDGPAFLSAAAILAVIASAASYPPARRIAAEDAAIALRTE